MLAIRCKLSCYYSYSNSNNLFKVDDVGSGRPILRATRLMFRKRSTQQINVSFSCIYPVIDHEFRHNIVKVAVDSRGHSRVDPQTTLTM